MTVHILSFQSLPLTDFLFLTDFPFLYHSGGNGNHIPLTINRICEIITRWENSLFSMQNSNLHNPLSYTNHYNSNTSKNSLDIHKQNAKQSSHWGREEIMVGFIAQCLTFILIHHHHWLNTCVHRGEKQKQKMHIHRNQILLYWALYWHNTW